MAELADLSTPALIALGILAAVSLSLMVAGIIAVSRTDREHLPGGLPRVVWFLVCLVQFVGPLTFFILRRRERRMAEESPQRQSSTPGDDGIIDTLYG
ncbi:hypothetical protein [Flaviflexus huanghaiensis]|uniref:hypothetical protein n=1 Tax=Flaviflexus huanghaiensis TaxID=1111473 RepID=UPI0015F84517|nr:hypothetical protein [Flaviflexus huanghaiensis]